MSGSPKRTEAVLLVAAMPREFAGLPRNAGPFVTVAGGAGSARAAQTAASAMARFRPKAVVSFGFCGALDPALRIGDILVASEVEAAGERFPAGRPAAAPPHITGVLTTIDRVAQTAGEKAKLRATGAAAVDMEAGGVAREAARHGIPFYCVRAITDLSDESFTVDFNSALHPDGHFATMLLLRQVFREPATALPELLRLRKRCAVAARKLGEFIAGCRF